MCHQVNTALMQTDMGAELSSPLSFTTSRVVSAWPHDLITLLTVFANSSITLICN